MTTYVVTWREELWSQWASSDPESRQGRNEAVDEAGIARPLEAGDRVDGRGAQEDLSSRHAYRHSFSGWSDRLDHLVRRCDKRREQGRVIDIQGDIDLQPTFNGLGNLTRRRLSWSLPRPGLETLASRLTLPRKRTSVLGPLCVLKQEDIQKRGQECLASRQFFSVSTLKLILSGLLLLFSSLFPSFLPASGGRSGLRFLRLFLPTRSCRTASFVLL
jgi:hypothetical protein